MSHLVRSSLWLSFFGAIVFAWWMMYVMAMDMDLDLLGRPGPMGQAMAGMDPRMPMDMPMARFGPLGRSQRLRCSDQAPSLRA